MKVALVCPASLPATQFGGIVFLAVDLAREISNMGHEVTIYTTDLDFSNGPNKFNKNLPRLEKFEKLNELCDAIFISSIKLNKFYKTFLFKKYKNCINSSKVCNGYLFFLNLYFKIFYCSLLTGTNLFPLIMRLFLTYLKYEK